MPVHRATSQAVIHYNIQIPDSSLRVFTERLAQLWESLRCEGDALEKAQPGVGSVGGGTFEWVDSLLVKALRSGDWLLIDNCLLYTSPSPREAVVSRMPSSA